MNNRDDGVKNARRRVIKSNFSIQLPAAYVYRCSIYFIYSMCIIHFDLCVPTLLYYIDGIKIKELQEIRDLGCL